MNKHEETKALATILTTKITNNFEWFGIVVSNKETLKILNFIEKPQKFIGDEINAGLYVLNKKVLDQIPLQNYSIEW